MAGPESLRSRAKVWAAGAEAARRRAGIELPRGFEAAIDRLRPVLWQWVLAEVSPGRLAPWLPVAFGFGIVLYFAADREPAAWAALALAVAASAIAIPPRRAVVGRPLALAFTAAAAGFAVATVHTSLIVHPVLARPAWSVAITGFVEAREERERTDRIVVGVNTITGRRLDAVPRRVRISVRRGTAPAVGAFVALKANLSPPLAPLQPGGYDFARDMYFSRLGASGFVLGKIRTEAPPLAAGAWLRAAAAIDAMRYRIDTRIRAVIPGDEGSIASALITGRRDAISPAVRDAFYVSSLAHVLAISGFHMALVAGIAFFFIRGGLALFPGLASRHPIKKWAAVGALSAAAYYLVLSGAGVSTQRSFVMIAIVLIGVIADRRALTFRTLTIAAFAVLILAPQALMTPSFQMLFAATLALIAGYQYGLPWRTSLDTSLGARIALWGGREVTGIVFASLIAGLATTPYAAYNFYRLAPYGVLANLLAMPVVSAWVMPMGILGLLALPLGFDALFWRLMGKGIDWMITVVLWVAHLPGAVGRIHAFGTGPLLLLTAGLLLLCLLRSPLRWTGALVAIAASLWAVMTPQPDLLVAADGQAAAFRGADGRLAVLHVGRDSFAVKEWLIADGDGRDIKDPHLHDGVRCDPSGCVGRLFGGGVVAYELSADAFEDDCRRALFIVAWDEPPPGCAARVIGRNAWRDHGALAVRHGASGFAIEATRPDGLDRPWSPAPAQQTASRSAPPNATPSREDIDADP